MRKLVVLGLAAAACGFVSTASAALTFTSVQGGGYDTSLPGVQTENFDNLALGGAGGLLASGITVSFVTDGKAVQGSASGLYAPPYLSGNNGVGFGNPGVPGQDTTRYLTSGKNNQTTQLGSATLQFATPITYFGLLWGSIDSYNTLTLYNGNSVIGTIIGSQVSDPAAGNQQIAGTHYVNIYSDLAFDRVVATSSQYAFEFDNVAFAPVPEPATLLAGALLLLPFGASTLRRFRKN